MTWEGLSVLAVVPARGGSKAIPKKNLRKVGGVSLVGRAAQIAHSLPWLDHAILSTDDEEIANEGRRYSLDVPFMRLGELSTDTATSAGMWRHAWLEAEKHYGRRFEISILLEPTSPLRRAEDVERTMSALLTGDFDAAATVNLAPAHFTPQKCLTVDDTGIINFYLEDGAEFSIRQKIPPYYFRNGICYAVKRATLLEGGRILEKNCVAVVIERPVVNIDEPFELEVAEWLLSREGRDV
ncbi:MAG: acylneuraminate cytidylyltransferase family protein [Gammaproteobacteria bacterium]|nr:acylneuraminate cytidylyltransferase family protein [Gammaproteobacteria bacterium]